MAAPPPTKVTLSHAFGSQFRGVNAEGRSLTLSGSPAVGPSEEGVRPMEAVLLALAGCSALDVLLILGKGKHRIDSLDVAIEGVRADAVPAVFETIHLQFRASGDFSAHKLERAVALSMEKYCSVSRMLEPTVRVTHGSELAV